MMSSRNFGYQQPRSFDEELERAYLRGLNRGCQEGYDNGFYEGKNQGYRDGSYAEQKRCKKILSQELKKAYQNGYDSAESSGYQRRFEAGHTAGFKECEDKFEQQEYSGYILLPSSVLRGSTLLPTLQLTTSAALPSPLTPGTQFADDDDIPSEPAPADNAAATTISSPPNDTVVSTAGTSSSPLPDIVSAAAADPSPPIPAIQPNTVDNSPPPAAVPTNSIAALTSQASASAVQAGATSRLTTPGSPVVVTNIAAPSPKPKVAIGTNNSPPTCLFTPYVAAGAQPSLGHFVDQLLPPHGPSSSPAISLYAAQGPRATTLRAPDTFRGGGYYTP